MALLCHRLKVWRALCRDWAYTKKEHKNCKPNDHEIRAPPIDYEEDRR